MNNDFYKGNHKKGEIEIKNSDTVFENKYISIYNDAVIFPSGYNGTYIRICTPSPQSVAVLPITSDKKILLIKNFRHGVRGWAYEVPKGGVEKGEDCVDAVLRELMEETGFSAEKLIDLGEYADSPAIFNSNLRCFIALDCSYVSSPTQEKTEAIQNVITISIDEFINGQYQLDFNDALTELLIYKYIFNFILQKGID